MKFLLAFSCYLFQRHIIKGVGGSHGHHKNLPTHVEKETVRKGKNFTR